MTTELNAQTVGYDHYLGVLEVRKSNKAYRCFQEVRTTRLKVNYYVLNCQLMLKVTI